MVAGAQRVTISDKGSKQEHTNVTDVIKATGVLPQWDTP